MHFSGRGIWRPLVARLSALLVFPCALISAGPELLFVPVEGSLGPEKVEASKDGIEDALKGGRLRHVVLELTLEGGDVDSLLGLAEYAHGLEGQGVLTHCLILEAADTAAATLLASACKTIAVAPAAKLGRLSELRLDATARDKILAWARISNRAPAIFKRMTEGKEELSAYLSSATDKWEFLTKSQFEAPGRDRRGEYIDKASICGEGEPLVLSAADAHKYGVAELVAGDRWELLRKLGLVGLKKDDIEELGGRDPLGRGGEIGMEIAEFIQQPFIRFLLILGGILTLFIEFQIPGFGVPGVIGLACFAIFFGSGLATGHVSYLELGLFLVSAALIGIELLVLPGFGLAGIAGITGLLVSLVLGMYKGGGEKLDWTELQHGVFTTLLSVTCAGVAIAVSARYLPKNALVRRSGLVHEAEIAGTSRDGESASAGEAATGQWPVGETGVAATKLRPAGKARVGDKLLDVVAEAEVIEAGTPIVVVRREGLRIVVRPREERI